MQNNLGIRDDLDVLAELSDWTGKQVLDVGCGAGRLSFGIALLGATVRGFEPDPIQAARNREAPAQDGVSLEEAGAEALPVRSDEIDVVLFSRSLHHIPADLMDRALSEARRVLKPDGVLVVIEPDIHGQFSQLIRPFHDETAVRAQALDALTRAQDEYGAVEELWFTTEFRFESFVAFRDRMSGLTFNEIAAEAIDRPVVRAAFEAGRVFDGYRFTNPMRVRVHRRPAAS